MSSKFIESGTCGVLGGHGELDRGTLAPLDHLGMSHEARVPSGALWHG